MSLREIEIPAERAGRRADAVVGEALGLSRRKLKELFEQGKVRLGKKPVRKGDTVEAGQRIQIAVDEPLPTLVAEPDAPLVVLHADEAFVFLDKPSGMPSHPLASGEIGTLANALVARYPECAGASPDAREGGLCHRLDVETSGVVLAARTPHAWQAARRSFQQREVGKYYLALVAGPIADEGEVAVPLRHDPKHPNRVEAAPEDPKARKAQTLFRVLARSGSYSLVQAQIITGVLHQVRAHLAAIGAPVVGDRLYEGPSLTGLDRFFLHARALSIRHPVEGKQLTVSSPLPSDLTKALQTANFGPEIIRLIP
jgi:23S rRNA pseudouridine1911/1915/1917 synthase